jgi:hypothetical protein
MSRAQRIIVISEAGRLVGTHIPSDQKRSTKGPVARIVAGPGQALHEVKVKVPDKFSDYEAINSFHELVRRKAALT